MQMKTIEGGDKDVNYPGVKDHMPKVTTLDKLKSELKEDEPRKSTTETFKTDTEMGTTPMLS